MIKKVAFIPLFVFVFHQAYAQDYYSITVNVNGAKSNQGKMYFAIYNKESKFLKERFKSSISKIEQNKSVIKFLNIPKGTYAVSVFHDENSNGKLDKNFVGIPKEDYGCSNNAKGFMAPPKWKNAKFTIESDMQITINL